MDAAHIKVLATEVQTTLDLVDELVAALQDHPPEGAGAGRVTELVGRLSRQPRLLELPAVLLHAHEQITEILAGIRVTRATIEAHAVERIRDTQNKLSDVTLTTESATLELMNGLDRSLELINSLEARAGAAAATDGFEDLRGHVSTLYNHLQFQDITAQQLQGVTHSLIDLEVRVTAAATLFDRGFGTTPAPVHAELLAPGASRHLAYNPDATMRRGTADQALIDRTFEGARHGQPSEHNGDAGRVGV